MINVFGNSHAAVFTGAPPCGDIVPKEKELPYGRGYTEPHPSLPFRTWFLGPVIGFNFTKNHFPKIKDHINEKKEWFPQSSKIVLHVGEVDCRIHLPKQLRIQKTRSRESLAYETVDRFFQSGMLLKSMGFDPIFFGTHPIIGEFTNPEEGFSHLDDGDHWGRWGCAAERSEFCMLWNSRLKENCENNGLNFISIYKYLVDDNGEAKKEFYRDSIHLEHNKCIQFIVKEFESKGISLDCNL